MTVMTTAPEAPTTRQRRGTVAVLFAAISLLLAACDLAPIPGDSPLRYRDEIFGQTTKTADIVYGTADDQEGNPVTLRLDVYRPTGDTVTARPLIIWVHGGSFAFGNKNSPEIVDQATTFAKKGYVTASISYRLDDQGCTEVDAGCIEAIYDANADAQAAVRFLRAHAGNYGIDPERIAINGTSAGAITALHVSYDLASPGELPPDEASEVRAAVSLSGAGIFRDDLDADDAKTLLFHGTADALVPYQWAVDSRDDSVDTGVTSYLLAWEGEGHVPYVAHRDEIIDLSTNFLYRTLDVANA